jgi:uncharacterized membrane protein
MPFGNYLAEVTVELARLAQDRTYRERMRHTRSRRYWAAVWVFAGVWVVIAMTVGLVIVASVLRR